MQAFIMKNELLCQRYSSVTPHIRAWQVQHQQITNCQSSSPPSPTIFEFSAPFFLFLSYLNTEGPVVLCETLDFYEVIFKHFCACQGSTISLSLKYGLANMNTNNLNAKYQTAQSLVQTQ